MKNKQSKQMSKSIKNAVTIQKVDETELFQKYGDNSDPWPCNILLDCSEKILYADSRPGKVLSQREIDGCIQKFDIPCLTGAAANELMKTIKPVVKIVVSGYDTDWDSGREIAIFTEKAQEAIEEIQRICREEIDNYEIVCVWGADEWLDESVDFLDYNGEKCSQDDDYVTVNISGDMTITSETTDEDLSKIEKKILVEARDQDVQIIEGLSEWLQNIRVCCIKHLEAIEKKLCEE